eukprot:4693820-Pyramimonas_sp.AAC.1
MRRSRKGPRLRGSNELPSLPPRKATEGGGSKSGAAALAETRRGREREGARTRASSRGIR